MFNPICQRMRRVITTAAIAFIITKSDDEWRTLIHQVNDERHIADDEAAFTLGYYLGKWIFRKSSAVVSQVDRSDWRNLVLAVLPPYAKYEKQVMQDDLRCIQMLARP